MHSDSLTHAQTFCCNDFSCNKYWRLRGSVLVFLVPRLPTHRFHVINRDMHLVYFRWICYIDYYLNVGDVLLFIAFDDKKPLYQHLTAHPIDRKLEVRQYIPQGYF